MITIALGWSDILFMSGIFLFFMSFAVYDKTDWAPAIPFAIVAAVLWLVFYSIFGNAWRGVILNSLSFLALFLIFRYLRYRDRYHSPPSDE